MIPKLFILQMPFSDKAGEQWFCSHCAMIEGALMVNPHWFDDVEVIRMPSEKPRKELVKILGDEHQWVPVLILNNGQTLTDPIKITMYLAEEFGGASPHP